MNTFVLIMVLFTSAGHGSMASLTQEFSNKEACEMAKESVRQKTGYGTFLLLTCEKK